MAEGSSGSLAAAKSVQTRERKVWKKRARCEGVIAMWLRAIVG
jgi:hypothetical protein